MSTLTAEPALAFQDESAGETAASPRPAQLNARLSFQDCTVVPALRAYLKASLHDEDTYLRFLPPLKGSSNPYWMLAAEYYRFRHTAFVHPSAFEPGAECLVERALNWFRENAPDQLPQQGLTVAENDRRFQLRPKPVAFAWALKLVHGKPPELVLLRQSNHSGNGKEGLMAKIWAAVNQQLQDPDGTPAGYAHDNITHSQTGGYVHIKKVKNGPQRHNVEYTAIINSKKATGKAYPLMPLLQQLPEAARKAIVPLQADRILHRPTEQEQLAFLKAYLGKFFFEVFPDQAPRRASAPGTDFAPNGRNDHAPGNGHDFPAPPAAGVEVESDGAFDDGEAGFDPLNGRAAADPDADQFEGASFDPLAAEPAAAVGRPRPAPAANGAAAKRKAPNGKAAGAAAPANGGEPYPPFHQNVTLEIMRDLFYPATREAGLRRYAHYKAQLNEAQIAGIEAILKDGGTAAPA